MRPSLAAGKAGSTANRCSHVAPGCSDVPSLGIAAHCLARGSADVNFVVGARIAVDRGRQARQQRVASLIDTRGA